MKRGVPGGWGDAQAGMGFFEDIWRVTNLIDGTFDGICLVIVKFIYKNQIVKDDFRAVPSRPIYCPTSSWAVFISLF